MTDSFFTVEENNGQIEQPTRIPQDNLYDRGFLRVITTIPTDVPTNPLDKFRLYINGATMRLYVYDSSNGDWRYTTLT